MDTVSIASLASSMAQTKTETAVQVSVLRKALDIQTQGAQQLIQAAAQAIPTNPPHLGNKVDVRA